MKKHTKFGCPGRHGHSCKSCRYCASETPGSQPTCAPRRQSTSGFLHYIHAPNTHHHLTLSQVCLAVNRSTCSVATTQPGATSSQCNALHAQPKSSRSPPAGLQRVPALTQRHGSMHCSCQVAAARWQCLVQPAHAIETNTPNSCCCSSSRT